MTPIGRCESGVGSDRRRGVRDSTLGFVPPHVPFLSGFIVTVNASSSAPSP